NKLLIKAYTNLGIYHSKRVTSRIEAANRHIKYYIQVSTDFFFFVYASTTVLSTLSLHDALPISPGAGCSCWPARRTPKRAGSRRSEEHTSELQSRRDLVCRLLLEKKKNEWELAEIKKLFILNLQVHAIVTQRETSVITACRHILP